MFRHARLIIYESETEDGLATQIGNSLAAGIRLFNKGRMTILDLPSGFVGVLDRIAVDRAEAVDVGHTTKVKDLEAPHAG